ncbi:uncharacterized protein LOC112468134 [Temnothorax curvispinosus]|uniref:Uncharacterized protein LOC112468134 n=1 Tax=Temnothorax curvispinosus TaxID=300111 RepID=A0A6J1RDV8_9HYME|nr:uncharacterized protein LOC112468134 [Temnothorax curvispinosus]
MAPLKTISIPFLELEAALLLIKLYAFAKDAYGNRINDVKLKNDSQIVLAWIRARPHELKTFVANRVTKIQNITENIDWGHVPTDENPADLLSKGTTADVLEKSKLWWHGPPWIFKTRALDKQQVSAIKIKDLERADQTILRKVQQEAFSEELTDLRRKRRLSRKSKLQSLDPFIDEEGLIRVGGRLRHASVPANQKHPIVLPAKHRVTSLIMQEEHSRLLHCPPEHLFNAVRQRYWPLIGRRETRKTVKGCLNCFRFRPTVPGIKMGDLSKQRVISFDRPFRSTGMDYAGPLQLRESRRREKLHLSKEYIAIFTCLSTKAVHIELVSDMTTEAFLAALNRFTARRGICSEIFSDNGTNFVGASEELKEVYTFLEKESSEIGRSLANQRIKWSFIPPRAPYFGGDLLIQPAQYDYAEVPENHLTRWQNLQKLHQQFWIRWHREYLNELQQRTKWSDMGDNIKLNTVVLIKEDHLPPLQWALGRVTALHPGQDGVVRVITILLKDSPFKGATDVRESLFNLRRVQEVEARV